MNKKAPSRLERWLIGTALLVSIGAIAVSFPGPWLLIGLQGAAGRMDASCTWASSVAAYRESSARMRDRQRLMADSRLLQRDGELALWAAPGNRHFWIPFDPDSENASLAISYFQQGPRWAQPTLGALISTGDVVIDAGGHVGESALAALQMGAGRVISIEPDPLNAEALRRNLSDALATGRLTIVQKAIWDKAGTLKLERHHTSTTTTVHEQGEGIDVPMVPLDEVVEELRLERVDFIKMDIEGAEPPALRGSVKTLKRFKPRLAIATYHTPADLDQVRNIVGTAVPDYSVSPARCLPAHEHIFPHLLFFH